MPVSRVASIKSALASFKKYTKVGGGWICAISVTKCYGNLGGGDLNYFCYLMPQN